MLRSHRRGGRNTLREFAEASKTRRAAKTLVKQGPFRITLAAIKKGTTLRPHQVAGPVSIQILRGCLELTTDKGAIPLPTGSLVTLQAGLTHAATAVDDSAILITFAIP